MYYHSISQRGSKEPIPIDPLSISSTKVTKDQLKAVETTVTGPTPTAQTLEAPIPKGYEEKE